MPGYPVFECLEQLLHRLELVVGRKASKGHEVLPPHHFLVANLLGFTRAEQSYDNAFDVDVSDARCFECLQRDGVEPHMRDLTLCAGG